MIVAPRQCDSSRQDLLAGVIAIIAQATCEDATWASAVTASCRLEGDLWLDSIDLRALAGLLASAYGDEVDLAAFLAGADIDKLIVLTVGDLVGYIAGCLGQDLEGAK